MQDVELRSALLSFFNDVEGQCKQCAEDLSTVRDSLNASNEIVDAIDPQLRFVQNLRRATNQVLSTIRNDEAREPKTPADLIPAPELLNLPAPPSDTKDSLPKLEPYEQVMVTSFNEEPNKWMRKFNSISFGAENVNEIWGKGGEPRFARKEGGIYQLIEAGDVCYIFPEPGLRLQESYRRSEGLDYLFQVDADLTDAEPHIALISPAKLEEAGGRWKVLSKGEIRGRS